MKILLIAEVYLPKVDGVVMRMLNLIRQLQQQGVEVRVVCAQHPEDVDSPVRFYPFDSFSLRAYPEYYVGQPNGELVEIIDDFQPDVIHLMNPFAFGFRCFDVLAAGRVQCPVVFSFHTLYAEFVKRYGALKPLSNLLWSVTRSYHSQAHVNLAVSQTSVDDLSDRGFERVHLWQPAVDAELFHPDAASHAVRQELQGQHDRKHLLLTTSRLAPEKNVEFLVDVLKRMPDASLAIVGDGPHRSQLEKAFAGLPCEFVGYRKGEDLAAAYASADAFVYASETETMGNVILEALASRLPVIAPQAGGIPSLVEHNVNGLLYEPGNDAQCTRLTLDVLNQAELTKRLTAAGREFAENHTWAAAASRVRSDYQRAINLFETAGQPVIRPVSYFHRTVVRSLVAAFRVTTKEVVARRDPESKRIDCEACEATETSLTESGDQLHPGRIDEESSAVAMTTADSAQSNGVLLPATSTVARQGAISVFDTGLVRLMNRSMSLRGVQPFFATVSWLGDGKIWYVLMACVTLANPEGWKAAGHMLAVGLVNLILYKLVKAQSKRPRPCNACEDILRGTAPLDEYSFPSGHTMHAVGFTVVATVWFPALMPVLLTFTVAVMLSRMILGLHYPTDVLLGAVLGFLTAQMSFSVLGL